MVPSPDDQNTWMALTKARTQLRDPGLYRWPPHANLLYPFIDPFNSNNQKQHPPKEKEKINSNSSIVDVDEMVLNSLQAACRQCEPFRVRLERFGTFGGNKRGVLWLYPYSYSDDERGSKVVEENVVDAEQPLVHLQHLLERQFPDCTDQRKVSGAFHPHMTLSHFANLTDAKAAQEQIQQWWPTATTTAAADASPPPPDAVAKDDDDDGDGVVLVDFEVSEIYLLHRQGDAGQFERLVTVELGSRGALTVHQPTALPFPLQPDHEADWVHQERMKLKQRRRQGGGYRGRRQKRGGRRRSSPRVRDTPEVIAAKRAERKAKKEAMLQAEQQQQQQCDE